MKLLLGTHLLLWAAGEPERLSPAARALLDDPANALLFSAAGAADHQRARRRRMACRRYVRTRSTASCSRSPWSKASRC